MIEGNEWFEVDKIKFFSWFHYLFWDRLQLLHFSLHAGNKMSILPFITQLKQHWMQLMNTYFLFSSKSSIIARFFFGTPICNCTLQIWIFLDIASGKWQYVSVSQHMMETWAVIGHPSALVTWWYHCKLKFNSMTWYWYCHQCNGHIFKDISHWDNYDGNFLTGQLIYSYSWKENG